MITLLQAIAVVAGPLLVFLVGVRVMKWLTGQPKAESHRIANNARAPLNQRLYGYDADDVAAHWAPFSPQRLRQERKALRLDLLFPLVYGGAFLGALYLIWNWLGRPFSVHWLIAPIALMALSDWTENGVQLHQLGRWMRTESPGVKDLNRRLVRLASVATTTKIWLFCGNAFFLAILAWLWVRKEWCS